MENFNRLTPAEDERLAWLLEELGEAVQAIGKIQRHGYQSDNKGLLPVTNRQALERELGDIAAACVLMIGNDDVNEEAIDRRRSEKLRSVGEWLHHQDRAQPGHLADVTDYADGSRRAGL